MRLSSVALVLVFAAPAVCAQPAAVRLGDGGVLVVPLVPDLAFDAGLGTPGTAAPVPASALTSMSGPRGRGAWRGAKRGFLVGLAVGAAVTAVVALSESCNPGSDYICGWHIAAAAAVPFTVLTTGAGAAIGAATARPGSPAAPPTEGMPGLP